MAITLEEISKRLNDYPVFVILAETLDRWQPPATDEGRAVLHKHYLWLLDLEQQRKLLMAGPMNMDKLSGPGISVNGVITGMILIKAANRQEAESIALQDPFHTSGYRNNTIHTLNIRFGAFQ